MAGSSEPAFSFLYTKIKDPAKPGSSENKKKPYSDRLLGEKLTEKGISISRRTVAKYREEEGIPDASGRKEYT